MNGKLIGKKLLSQILYFFIFTILLMLVGNFIPNPIYMVVIGGLALAGLVYLRRSKRGEPEEEYLAGTTSDDLPDDIKYLLGSFSEFRAEAVSAAIIAGLFIVLDILGSLLNNGTTLYVGNEEVQYYAFDLLSVVFMYAVFFIVNAVIWLILFRQYHSSRVKH